MTDPRESGLLVPLGLIRGGVHARTFNHRVDAEVAFVAVGLIEPDEFNPTSFDVAVQELLPPGERGDRTAKYIVHSTTEAADTLYVFPKPEYHLVFHSRLEREIGTPGQLRSAGFVSEIDHPHLGMRYILHGVSESLRSRLPYSASYDYRENVLKPKLAPKGLLFSPM